MMHSTSLGKDPRVYLAHEFCQDVHQRQALQVAHSASQTQEDSKPLSTSELKMSFVRFATSMDQDKGKRAKRREKRREKPRGHLGCQIPSLPRIGNLLLPHIYQLCADPPWVKELAIKCR